MKQKTGTHGRQEKNSGPSKFSIASFLLTYTGFGGFYPMNREERPTYTSLLKSLEFLVQAWWHLP